MATIVFTEGGLASQLADTGWADMKADLSTKPCSGGGAHTADETYAGNDYGVITGTGYTAQTATEPSASAGSKTWPTVSFSTGTATDWSSAVKSVVYRRSSDNKLLFAMDLSATRDMSAAYRTITHTLTSTSAVS